MDAQSSRRQAVKGRHWAAPPPFATLRLPSGVFRTMTTVQSFAPIEPASAKVLILGSMPGKVSLRAGQYYAHPRNAFWPILGRLLGFDAALAYDDRVARLHQAQVGVWDVLAACTRTSSLDSDIVEASIVPNDFPAWFQRQPETRAVFCNGAKAYDSYRKYVLPLLPADHASLPLLRLPSTSPAHARLKPEEKFADWAIIQTYLFR